MTTRQRIARVEDDLTGLETLHLIMSEVDELGLEGYARRIAERPIADAPLSRIFSAVETKTRAGLKGQSEPDVRQEVRRRVEEAAFLFHLVMRLNEMARPRAARQGLLACCLSFWLASLFGVRLEDDADEELVKAHVMDWGRWRWALDGVVAEMARDAAARHLLEERYLGGRVALFAETLNDEAATRDIIDRLVRVAETFPTGQGKPSDQPAVPLVSVEDEAVWIVDQARIHTFENMGDRESAVAVLERRLLGRPA